MFGIRGSTATSKAKDLFFLSRRHKGEDNVAWVNRQYAQLKDSDTTGGDQPTYVLLLGGNTPTDFRLRVAQSALRHDYTPSHWSHVALVRGEITDETTPLIEVSLEPAFGFRNPPATNGLQDGYLGRYRDPSINPNCALLQLPVSMNIWAWKSTEKHRSIIEQFTKQRVVLDVPGLILRWLAFIWGVEKEGNPLLAGYGVPSAAAIETLLSASGYDLSPGLDSGASSPEAFWQTANWWHPYYKTANVPPVRGAFHIGHRIQIDPVRATQNPAAVHQWQG